jgi:hypothetical protein
MGGDSGGIDLGGGGEMRKAIAFQLSFGTLR